MIRITEYWNKVDTTKKINGMHPVLSEFEVKYIFRINGFKSLKDFYHQKLSHRKNVSEVPEGFKEYTGSMYGVHSYNIYTWEV